jgi:hypothetical protein
MSEFYDQVLQGNQIKELVKVLLEKSGYVVFPYGYENTLSGLMNLIKVKDAKKSRTVRRIKSSPDLLVFSKDRKDLLLVEVKMRKAPDEKRILLYANRMSVLVIVVPCGNVFYAQKTGELEIKEEYNALTDFVRFEEIFTETKEEDVSHFRNKALEIMQRLKKV